MMSKGELELVEWLRANLPRDAVRVPIGIGDDMAAVRWNANLVAITSDMLLDGVHFDARRHPFELIGRKAIACSLSDCAAMACTPRGATVSLALPDGMRPGEVQELYHGMSQIASQFDCPIVGGDTTSWTGALAIDVTIIAEPMSSRGPIQRSTARTGDTVYVSGALGGSIRGRHTAFTPRLDLARRLAAESELHAMMDISDGLSLDLHRLCVASGLGAELRVEQLEAVISQDARILSGEDGRSALDHALTDGEDFELLACGGPGLARPELGLSAVGRLAAADEPGELNLITRDGARTRLEPRGYEHFRQ